MDYNSLIADETTAGSIKRFCNWSRVDSEGILTEAEAWIYSRLRVRHMLARANITIADEATTADLPTGYLDPVAFGIPGYIPRLRYWDAERFQALLGWDTGAVLPEAPPTVWSDFDEVINLNSKSDQAYTGKLIHYRTPDALSVSNTTNFLTTRYPTLLRYVCTKFAFEERKDRNQENNYELRALAEIDRIKMDDDLAKRGMDLDFNWASEADDWY